MENVLQANLFAYVMATPMVPIGYMSLFSTNCLIVVFGMKLYSVQDVGTVSTTLESSSDIIQSQSP
jgi:hypothetical protein